MSVDRELFIAKAEEIAAEEPSYRHGGSGTDGTCDCIGIIIGAIRRAGGQWRGMHGCNYAARAEMKDLKQIVSTGDLIVGEAVFRVYEPGQGGYNLPERYGPGGQSYTGDLRDYFHVGIVESVHPLRIRHMTKPRPKMDTSIDRWDYHGKLKKISYGGEGSKMQHVIISGGNPDLPVNFREYASRDAKIIGEIHQGSKAVLIDGEGGTWNRIQWNQKTGYVMSAFVHPDDSGGDDGEMITVSRKELEQAYDILGDLLGLRG